MDNISGSKQTTRGKVRTHIQKMISTGELKPGDRIVETKLAKEMNVSQAPVREAILELCAMGLLEERTYSGTFVRALSPEDIEDIYSIRAYLEEYAAKRAAKNRTPEDLKMLKDKLAEMSEAKTFDEYFPLDVEFHELVMDSAHSHALKRAWQNLFLPHWTYTSTLITHRSLHDLNLVHHEIYQYIARGADHSAGSAMFLHIKSFTDELIEHLTEFNEEAITFPQFDRID